jgi:hypothetical protein
LALVPTSLSSLYVTTAISVTIAVLVVPFLVDAIVFVALLLPSANGGGKNTHNGNGNKVAGNKESNGGG